MGGPWKARAFDPLTWRPPTPRVAVESRGPATASPGAGTARIVIGYVAAVLASCAILLGLLTLGW